MASHWKDSLKFNDPQPNMQVGHQSLYAGMPVGIQLFSEYDIRDWSFINADDVPGVTDGGANGFGASWVNTAVSAGAGTSAYTISDDLFPPRLIATTAAADNDGIQTQYTEAGGAGEFVRLRASKRTYFEVGFGLTDANDDLDTVQQCDFFFGFAITDTTVLGGATDFIGFSKVDGSGLINFVAGKNAGASGALVDDIVLSTGKTLVAADAGTAHGLITKLGFMIDHSSTAGTANYYAYVDGALVAQGSSTTEIPDDEQLAPTIAFLSGEAVAKILHISQFMFCQQR